MLTLLNTFISGSINSTTPSSSVCNCILYSVKKLKNDKTTKAKSKFVVTNEVLHFHEKLKLDHRTKYLLSIQKDIY